MIRNALAVKPGRDMQTILAELAAAKDCFMALGKEALDLSDRLRILMENLKHE